MLDTAKDGRLGRIFMNRTIRVYPAFSEFYGMEETIERIVELLPPRRAGPGGAQADPLSARPGRRRQVVPGRAPEGADGGPSDLRAQGGRRDQPGLREPARPVRSRARWATMLEERYGIPRRRLTGLMSPWCHQAPRRVRRRHLEVPGRQDQPVAAAADRHRQDRAGRREQPGHLVARRQGRHPQAGDALPGRSRRLQLFGRPEPRQPGHPRIRRDVQGADQDAASPAHRDAGGQLCRHREYRRDPVHRHRHGPFQRGRVADLQGQQEQRGLHRPHLRHQGAVLPARRPRSRGSTRS